MADQGRGPASQQGDGQPENIEELQDNAGASGMSTKGRGRDENADRPSSAMGGTSDAGTAADDAAEAAALGRGLPEDRTQWTGQIPGAGTGADQGTRGFSGGTTPPEERSGPVNLDQPSEGRFEEPGGGPR